jgi:dTDP-4-dehydrorhamnose 3,5-epimerase
MRVQSTPLAGVFLIEPRVHTDGRGFFLETFSRQRYADAGLSADFVQDNTSRSVRNTLRGLHFQHPFGQGKLVSVIDGAVFDVAVDIRRGSPTFGRWFGSELSAENHHQLWIPPGCAHGFAVLSETALFSYRCTDYYHPETEHSLRWDDPDIGIEWPGGREWLLSPKDRTGRLLREMTDLPAYESESA